MGIMQGSTLIGAPTAGWVASEFGPRAAIQVGAVAGLLAFALGAVWLATSGKLHRHESGGLRVQIDDTRVLRVIEDTELDTRA
jgi:hypothetical protein